MSTRRKSSLATYEYISPNVYNRNGQKIRRYTPHCVAGNLKIETTLQLAAFKAGGSASTNYAIGTDGRIGLGVPETSGAWTSSSATNDRQAITCEIANNGGSPNWPMSDAAIESWIKLTVDCCKFYGHKKVVYVAKPSSVAVGATTTENWIKTWDPGSSDTAIITLHCWYSNKACPGPYFISKLPWIVEQINSRLGNQSGSDGDSTTQPPTSGGSKTIDEIAQEVIAGKWGNGADRTASLTAAGYNPTEVQNRVNEILTGASSSSGSTSNQTNYLINITATAINVRKGPGTNYAVVKTLRNDKNSYTIIEESTGTGANKWGKLKSGLGWIALDYTKKV